MKMGLFPKLAVDGIKKNSKIYFPYIISCIGMVMIYYIMHYLSVSPLVTGLAHGRDITMILSLGKFVVAFFSAVFLFYTNSFLIRRRNKEFGLYNVLGMNKKDIAKVIAFESLFIAVLSIGAGLFVGIVFSKLSELVLLNIVHYEVSFGFFISGKAICYTIETFAVIFFLLFIKSVVKVRLSNPLELLKSENAGEKPPKSNFVFAIIGVAVLAVAYYLAVTIKNPLSALYTFFIAVILVIIATYILMISGSVALCKILQKNKNYYYKKNHFISVSSMAYRMKRNGAGLASICILCTMVLVIISSTVSLYAGAEDTLDKRFSRDCITEVYLESPEAISDKNISKKRAEYEKLFEERNVFPEKELDFGYAAVSGLYEDGGFKFELNPDEVYVDYDNLRSLYFVTVDDYNRVMGKDLEVAKGEAKVFAVNCDYDSREFKMGKTKLKISGTLDEIPEFRGVFTSLFPSICFVINDFSDISELETLADFNGDKMLGYVWQYDYEVDLDDEAKWDLLLAQNGLWDEETDFRYDLKSMAKEDYYALFGGLLFLGVLLSLVFGCAASLIIYYKQISEGYEDQSRFEIMQNVGMTKGEINKSINSQILTVFFLPLVFAGIHLIFAFPFIWRLITLFGFTNMPLMIGVTVIAFVAFGIIYAAIYKITAGAYYNIVVARKD